MCLLPNSGSLGLGISSVMIFGLLMLMLLDTSINMAMQPFKMLVGDMVNEKQKAKAYSIQSFLCNAGSVVGFLFPFVFTWIGLKNVAAEGVVPDSVIWSFYVGAAILILCVLYTTSKVKEWPPQEYAEYNPVNEKNETKANWFVLLKNAPAAFWRIGLVQFFCWAAFLYMWTYVVDAVSLTVWNTADSATADYQEAGNWTGVLYAIQAMGSVAWATLIPRFGNIKTAYAVSLLLGGIGFALIPFCADKYLQILPFLLIGCAWAAMLACPFTLVTNALQGYGHMGAYLGLFNGTICLPQIIAALCGGAILKMVGSCQSSMMYVAGFLLLVGAVCVFGIKTKK
jgi:maltose/moltooligosaccharide transporter